MRLANHLKLILCLMVGTATTFNIDSNKMPNFCFQQGTNEYNDFTNENRNCQPKTSGTFGIIYQCENNDGKFIGLKVLTIETEAEKTGR